METNEKYFEQECNRNRSHKLQKINKKITYLKVRKITFSSRCQPVTKHTQRFIAVNVTLLDYFEVNCDKSRFRQSL